MPPRKDMDVCYSLRALASHVCSWMTEAYSEQLVLASEHAGYAELIVLPSLLIEHGVPKA